MSITTDSAPSVSGLAPTAERLAHLAALRSDEGFKLDELTAMSLSAVHASGATSGSVMGCLDQLLRLAARHESRALAIDHEAFCVDIGGQG